MSPIKSSLAEFVGTFALTFVGAGSIIMTAALPDGGGGLVAVALAHGLILAVMVSATMHISGGQFNPAVSLALAAIKKQTWPQALTFIFAQLIGSFVAATLLLVLLTDLHEYGSSERAVKVVQLGATLGSMGLTAPTVLVLEIVATFLLMFSIMGSGVDPRGVGKTFAVGGFGIGLTVAANILFFGPLTGASMNPARSFGPACLINNWSMHWVYWVGPIIGATFAAGIYQSVFKDKSPAT